MKMLREREGEGKEGIGIDNDTFTLVTYQFPGAI